MFGVEVLHALPLTSLPQIWYKNHLNETQLILMLFLNNKKYTYYDLSGVDPIYNLGVYNFKKGTGSKLINCLVSPSKNLRGFK